MTNPSVSGAVLLPSHYRYLYGVSAEVSGQHSFRMICTYTLRGCCMLAAAKLAAPTPSPALRTADKFDRLLSVLYLSVQDVYSRGGGSRS